MRKYEVEFHTSNWMKYEYNLNATDGTILEKSVDMD